MSNGKLSVTGMKLAAEEIGARLRALRESQGLNQIEVARRVGFNSANTIKDYEKGQIPRTQHLVKLAQLYGVSIDYILFGRELRGAGLVASPPEPYLKLDRADRRLVDEIMELLQDADPKTKQDLRRQLDLVKRAHDSEK